MPLSMSQVKLDDWASWLPFHSSTYSAKTNGSSSTKETEVGLSKMA